ncbi:uncharacterized protein Z519_01927 [Cladophialophora bantiana CBS 173.52]|uniref:SnoaL-like domain-containing protein n=1 Tax=Cladophialophora bantiana (strain ATCC 10958 / CBS 173.52 / CDC B-1940 / NIH 8579) TaxID=1442370 RepID=A0A0D2F2X5_CLAB1|nr:uncharacterized protein Z519_01927 [Cladophialophora bantiana CBS 173.52]KIW96536.1 hypothetical protein Z519_01927 [Cladophialophora bantiana CBS 173.52]
MASHQRSIAIAFLDTFKDLDLESNLALRTPDCVHTIVPTTLSFTPRMSNEIRGAHLLSLKKKTSELPVTPKAILEGGNLVTIWATSKATFREEAKDEDLTVDWSYEGEYIFVLTFNQADYKIQHILEFIDSTKVEKVQVLLQRAEHNLAAKTDEI